MQTDRKKIIKSVFFAAVVCILLYWVLTQTERVKSVYAFISGIFSPFVIGACIAFILNVPMRAFENLFKFINNAVLRRVVAVILTLVCLLLVLTLVGFLLVPALLDAVFGLVESIPKFEIFVENLKETVKGLLDDYKTEVSWIKSNFDIAGFDWSSVAQYIVNIMMGFVSRMFGFVSGIFGALLDAFIAIVFALYCLFQKETLSRQGRKLLYAFLPENRADSIIRVLRLTNSTFSRFLSGQCIEVCILGTLFAITMAIFKMPYIPLISVLIAVTAFVPIVGAWIGCVVGSFLIFIHDPTSLQFIWFVVLSVVVQQIENNLIYPKVVGTSIGLSGMWVLVAVAVGGELFGVVGMFLMIPAASVIYTLVREFTNNKLSKAHIDSDKLACQPTDLQMRPKKSKKKPAPEKTDASQNNE